MLAVGITGHRQDALPPGSVDILRERIAEVLQLLAGGARNVHSANAEFFSNAPARLLFVSPLADGADQIAAEIALELGYELHAILPFERGAYRRELPDDARSRFDELLGRAVCVLELPGDPAVQLDAYVMAGRATVAHSDLMIAVWDALPPRGRGGTGEVVRLASDRATPTVHIPLEPGEPASLRWSAFDPAIVSHPEDRATIRRFDAAELGSVLNALLGPPPDPQERAFARQFQSECRRRMKARLEYPLLLAATGVSRFGRHHWTSEPAIANTRAEWQRYCHACDGANCVTAPISSLQKWYEWADSLASHFSQSYRSGHVFNFVLGAVAVVLALTALLAPGAKPYLAAVEFAAVLAILINTWLGTRQQWHRRWLDYRQLAERLRPMRSLKLVGVAAPDPPGTAANPVPRRWIDWYAGAVWRAIGCPHGRIDTTGLQALTAIIADQEVQPQVDYHRSTARQVERLDHRLELLGYGVFAATLAAIAVMLLALAIDHHWVADHLAQFTLLTAGLPAIGTALFGIRVQGDYVGSAVRSEQSARVLEQIASRLRSEDETIAQAGDLVEQAARAMLFDLDEWRLLNQQHDLSVG